MAGTTTWQLDPAHTSVEFSVKHMMMTTVRGRFKNLSGELVIDEDDPNRSRVTAELDVDSIDTGVPDRDAHLKSPDFFDAAAYPKISFRSKRVEGCSDKEGCRFTVTGDLTIRDTTMEVKLDCIFEGSGTDPWGGQRVGFGATGEFDRREWGLKWNQVIETGGVLVANKVRLEVEAQFVKQEAAVAVG